ncbi:MAG TPA: response regulator [Dehalococcoidia bacterium]|jgi:DNA-binding response OmpR family regulator
MGIGKKVLLVEDEATLRGIITRNLAARGHTVTEAASAREALARLSEARPNLMLLDISLPDRSGWDVLREMRRQDKNVPVVITSAVRVSQERIDEFRPLAFLPKPFSLEALLRIVAAARPKEGELVP